MKNKNWSIRATLAVLFLAVASAGAQQAASPATTPPAAAASQTGHPLTVAGNQALSMLNLQRNNLQLQMRNAALEYQIELGKLAQQQSQLETSELKAADLDPAKWQLDAQNAKLVPRGERPTQAGQMMPQHRPSSAPTKPAAAAPTIPPKR